MNRKTLTLIGSVVLLAIITYVGIDVYNMVKYSYRLESKTDGRLLKLFDEKKKDDIIVFSRLERSSDVIHLFTLKRDIHIEIWEVRSIANQNYECVDFTTQLNVAEIVQIDNSVTLNSGKSPESTMFLGPFIKEKLTVNIDKFAEDLKPVHGPNYKGYIGNINRFLISDENGEHKSYWNWRFDYTKQMVLAYTFENQLYLVVFYSKKDFDESVANILAQ